MLQVVQGKTLETIIPVFVQFDELVCIGDSDDWMQVSRLALVLVWWRGWRDVSRNGISVLVLLVTARKGCNVN